MNLSEQLYSLKCGFHTARAVIDPIERDVRMVVSNQDQRAFLQALHRLTGKPVRVSGQSKGYFSGQPAGVSDWIERAGWLELTPCRLDLVRSTAGSHGSSCHDILVVPDARPTHRLGICLLDLEIIEPAPAWAVA